MKKTLLVLSLFAAAMGSSARASIIGPTLTYGGHDYFKIGGRTPIGAENEAVGYGGHLVTINDAAENNFINLNFTLSTAIWIGLNDAVTEGTFVWSSGEAVTYTNWKPGEPDNKFGDEDYVIMESGGTGKWNDQSSGDEWYGVVEKSSVSSSVPDGGSTIILFGLAMGAVVGARRKASRPSVSGI